MLHLFMTLLSWPWHPPPPPPPPPTLLELWSDDLVWALGWLGFCLSLVVTQMPTALSMAIVQTCNNVTFTFQYALMGAWGGFSTQVIAATNGFLKIGAENGVGACKTLQRFTPLALVPLAAATYKSPMDLLPLSAVAGRLFSFQLSDMFAMRLVQLLALLPWVPYAMILNNFAALLTALLSIALQIFAIFNHHLKDKLTGTTGAKQKKA